MSNTDAQVLEQLKLARDAVLAVLVSGGGVVQYSIGDRSIRREATREGLQAIEELIRYYERKVNVATPGHDGRTFASFENEPGG